MKRRSNKSKVNILKVVSIILIIFFVLSSPILIQKLVNINKIECVSQYDTCPTEIESKLKSFEFKDYRFVKKEIIEALSKNFLVRDYSIQYQIPNKLIVKVDLNKPRYVIFNNSNGTFYLIDQAGVVLETSKESNLPGITKEYLDTKIGENIIEKDKFALEIVEKVAWLYSVKTGVIDKDELKITLKEGVLVRFPLEGSVDSLIGGLRLIFSRLNDESQGIRMDDIKEIDLRFKNPVLR